MRLGPLALAPALAVALALLPTAAASGSALAIDPPQVLPPVEEALVVPLGIDWAFDGVVCREAASAKLILSARESPGVVARLDPAVIDVPIPATGATGAKLSGRETTDLHLATQREGQGAVDVTATLALPDACLVLGGERRIADELRLPLELRLAAEPSPSTEAPVSTAAPRSESVLAAADESSQLRTVELTPRWHVPGPVIMLVVAAVGTLLVEAGRRVLRAVRRPSPSA